VKEFFPADKAKKEGGETVTIDSLEQNAQGDDRCFGLAEKSKKGVMEGRGFVGRESKLGENTSSPWEGRGKGMIEHDKTEEPEQK